VANREVTLGEAVEAATKSLMTILNDSKVFVTANVYEKDLAQIKVGQSVRVKANGINSTFSGRVSVIGAAVEGETRVIPVKAELNNSRELLKQGMFADLEIITDNTATDVLAIPTSAVVEANGKQLVYIQNGNAFQPVEVTLGQTSRDLVEVKSGLFAGDLIVVQRATQLYAQSLRGGSKDETKPTETPQLIVTNNQLPWWSFILAGGGVSAIAVGAFWLGRRTNTQVYVSDDSADSLSQLAALSQDSGINHK
ncbi:MAG TPA: HlyD family efflux transporter periplasmic adaptor subunit, partial [Nostocaceae cyanobacterium]|nr:HlyD family efflux transporter periplasmic adaptor subunit [Nostocaceae cyanobacterium]